MTVIILFFVALYDIMISLTTRVIYAKCQNIECLEKSLGQHCSKYVI